MHAEELGRLGARARETGAGRRTRQRNRPLGHAGEREPLSGPCVACAGLLVAAWAWPSLGQRKMAPMGLAVS